MAMGPTKADLVNFEIQSVDYEYRGMSDESIKEHHELN